MAQSVPVRDESDQGAQVDAGRARGPLARWWRGGQRGWLLVAVAVVVAVLTFAGRYFAVRESTDDAQIDGHVNPIAARVGGTVLAVLVKDNEVVEKGTLLLRIDPRDYEVAAARAQADLGENEASARAAHLSVPLTTTTTGTQVTAAESDLEAAGARLASARAQLREAEARDRKASQDLSRLRPLLAKDEVSQQEYDSAVWAADSARAAREAAEASVREAEKGVETARARLAQASTGSEQVQIASARAASAAAKVDQSRATLEQARLNLAYTEVTAPVKGVVSRKTVEVGQVVQPGQPMLAIVPLDDIWVTANFKENQLRAMRPGQSALISVDAYAGREYRGHVDSIAAATGSRFSLLPPENATGNYVKVVQRLPVKIVLEPGQDQEHRLRPGMSVVPTVLTK
ncbi:MAG TPA: HlyD family secretion protein [Vicinamibacteria bacterium]|nr:HlyD family secretion protein [Vicinamibacteria bacterium]